MRLILEGQGGPAAGRTAVVTADQPFYVGRTETSYLAVSSDRKMAPSHFVLECTSAGCWLRDLSGRAGTLVNGEKVGRKALKDGDVIAAGESTFLVRIDTGQGAPVAPAKPAEAAPAARPAAAPP